MNKEEEELQWRKALQDNTAVQEYFNKFNSGTIESFINDFIRYKKMWVDYGPQYLENMETDGIAWTNTAFNHLKVIQQKKLFNLQCLWRAEKVQLKEISATYDFPVWGDKILNCKFIDPISVEDIDLYSEFLKQCYDIEPGYAESWQDYEEIKEAYETDEKDISIPDWYTYYDTRRGTGSLISLPDIRGEKEEFYMRIWRKENNKVDKEKQEEWERTRDKRPFIPSWYERSHTDWFVRTFESKEIQKLYDAFNWSRRTSDDEEDMEWDLFTLYTAEGNVPIEAHYDWKEAVKRAARKYRYYKIADALPGAWEQYRMNIEMGIDFPFDSNETHIWLRDTFTMYIKKARGLNGEPEDLDF